MNEEGKNMNNYFDFTGKSTLITGAAGELGKALSEIFASNNSNLILTDMEERETELRQIADDLQKTHHIVAKIYMLDLRKGEEVKSLEKKLEENNVTIDILINNAGINIMQSAFMLSEEDWDNVVDTNMKGTFLMSQCAARMMAREKNNGIIVNISSQHGEVGNEKRAPYCASKAGIINLTRALAIEWARHNIRVNSVSPTFIINKQNEGILNSPQNTKTLLSNIPLGKYCTPSDVANAVLFLASAMADMITGHNLIVDGGYTAR